MAKLSRLGQYKLLRKLGQGGMGTVFEGIQDGLERHVAIKILSAQFLSDSTFVERFKREAKAAARLNHPNIVTIYEVGADQGFHFYSMELVDGLNLQQRLKQEGPLSIAESIGLMLQTLRGLSHAWDQQIVHRDIKPDNLMLSKSGTLKITDLGLARVCLESNTMTRTGAGMGTPYYMSPEQGYNAKEADLRSDIYSLGATFYHLLTGRVPFEGSSPIEVAIKVATVPFAPVRDVRPDTPLAVAAVIEKMMARLVENRFQTASELLATVELLTRERQPVAIDSVFGSTNSETVLNASVPGGDIKTSAMQTAKKSGDVLRLAGHDAAVVKCVFSPDGNRLLSGGEDGSIRCWDLADGREMGRFEGHTARITDIFFLSGNGTAVTSSLDSSIRWWGISNGKEIRSTTINASETNGFKLSPDTKCAFTAYNDNTIRGFDVSTGTEIHCFKHSLMSPIYNPIAIYPDSSHILCCTCRSPSFGYFHGSMWLWDTRSGSFVREIGFFDNAIHSIVVTKDMRSVIAGGGLGDQKMEMYDLSTGAAIRRFESHTNSIPALAISSDDRLAASGSGNVVRLWEVATGKRLRRLEGYPANIYCLAFSPNGRQLAIGLANHTIEVLEI